MDKFASTLEDVLDDISFRMRDWYARQEFTGKGLLICGTAFCMLILPLALFELKRNARASNSKKPRLPATSKRLPIPKPIKVKEIRVYPIKSCRGMIVPSVKVLETGLELDRNWMFVDAKTMNFLTIRQISEMTLIDTKLTSDGQLEVSVRTRPDIKFTIATHPTRAWLEANTKLSECEIWGTKTDGWVYPEAMTAGFSEFLGKDVRFVFKGPTRRDLPKQARPEVLGRVGSIKFADFMPVQVANQRSIEELNSRLRAIGEKEITIEHFRPNIVVEGEEPWYEDVWKTIRVGGTKAGNVTMDIPVRCARCQVPNVSPDTGIKNPKQPWDTLMKYRRIDKGINFKPCFGMLCVPRGEGFIEAGTDFEVLEVTEEHNYKGL
ncbi:uncharacterized protein PV09_08831 [Verruconis gallopava]|uniref:MOSC domain-containing protein n=1 Tax=Verruconis gallopava TaxID=253628 RepID=A0A0D1ZZT9_9PEZI|nr:uncharacterized protein PV09_08831 [Verruconis gallopava]KIV99529.1 hypothetical protein PV09_08831 [Verruconis gallopava]